MIGDERNMSGRSGLVLLAGRSQMIEIYPVSVTVPNYDAGNNQVRFV